jgi:single-strand DNA-binding protein
MHDTITTTGIVGTTPRTLTTSSGLTITSFRLAAQQRRFDSTAQEVKEETNWYTVTAFRFLAENVFNSIQKGDHLIVTGKLRVRDWENGEKAGTSVEIDAHAIGHDLNWGITAFTRVPHTTELVDGTPAEDVAF